MELKLTDENYCATVVRLDKFISLPGCDKIKHARVCNSLVIVSADAQVGDWGIYFPIESQINSLFLHDNNLYSNPKNNGDPSKKGFFGNVGRVKAVKLRGFVSEGFFAPLTMIFPFAKAGLHLNDKFNSIDGVAFCTKYTRPSKGKSHSPRAAKAIDRIMPGHFALHDKTKNLRYNIDKIYPDTQISITEKWHGCNAVIAKALCNPARRWYDSIFDFFGIATLPEYELVWSSRNVIKGVGIPKDSVNHYYDSDVWGKHAKELENSIPNGFILYGEIVGYAGEKQIQKGYTYGCAPGQSKFICFAIKSVSSDGIELNLTSQQVYHFCVERNIDAFKPIYQGCALDLFYPKYEPSMDATEAIANWQSELLQVLESEFIQNSMCKHNNNLVPEEGVIIKLENLSRPEFLKLKNWAFLEWESKQLDTDEVSIEEEN